jgi:hypothetical protein
VKLPTINQRDQSRSRVLGWRGRYQSFHTNTQRESDSGDVADGDVSFASFDRADVVGMEVSNLRHLFLGQLFLMPDTPHVGREKLLRSTLLSLVAHAGSISGQLHLIHTL